MFAKHQRRVRCQKKTKCLACRFFARRAPNQAEISGRLLTTFGAGVPNARVTLTDSKGETRSILSNGFGVYRFGGLQVGQTYTIRVESRTFAFTPLTVSVTDAAVSIDMIARQ